MTTSPPAVFLSYASEDTGSARKISDVLRSEGIVVWFDQAELRGGDAWDRKIRQEIQECAIFLPIISANTQLRSEGYFRLEWHLADQRTHLMGRRRAFLLPVCIDGTTEKAADVPDSFGSVHWVRAPQGDVPPDFVNRVRHLLAELTSGAGPTSSESPKSGVSPLLAPTRSKTSHSFMLAIAVVMACIAITAYAVWSRSRTAINSSMTHTESTYTVPQSTSERSIAVLAFLDMSEKHDQEYFSDGLAEELLDLLAKTPGLKVIARTSSFSFKGKPDDIPTIASKLHVQHILEGSVRRAGPRLRVSTQLILAKTGEQIWSNTFDRQVDDIFKVQDEIATAVVVALKLQLAPAHGSKHHPPNPAAYNEYLLGKQSRSRNNEAAFATAAEAFNRSIALDPDFGAAYADLTMVQTFLDRNRGRDVLAKDEAIARRAIELEPEEANGYVARAYVRIFLWDLRGAREDVNRAVALEPGNTDVQRRLGSVMAVEGRVPDSLAPFQRAVELDPLSGVSWQYLGDTLVSVHRFQEAHQAYQRAIDINPEDVASKISQTLADAQAGQPIDLGILERNPDAADRLATLAQVWQWRGDRSRSDEYLRQLIEHHASAAPFQISLIYAGRRDLDNTFVWLERAFELHDSDLGHVQDDYYDAPAVRRDPRYAAFLKKLNMVAPSNR